MALSGIRTWALSECLLEFDARSNPLSHHSWSTYFSIIYQIKKVNTLPKLFLSSLSFFKLAKVSRLSNHCKCKWTLALKVIEISSNDPRSEMSMSVYTIAFFSKISIGGNSFLYRSSSIINNSQSTSSLWNYRFTF